MKSDCQFISEEKCTVTHESCTKDACPVERLVDFMKDSPPDPDTSTDAEIIGWAVRSNPSLMAACAGVVAFCYLSGSYDSFAKNLSMFIVMQMANVSMENQ